VAASAPLPPAFLSLGPQWSVSDWVTRRQAALAVSARPEARPATALAHLHDPTTLPAPLVDPGQMTVSVDGRARLAPQELVLELARGMPFGRAVHAVLQHARLGSRVDPDDVEEAVRIATEAARERVDPAEVMAAVSAALCSPAAMAAAAARRSWREAFVAAEIDDVVIEGFVDLLWEDDAGLHVADWKTDRVVSSADRRARADRYVLQLATYAVVLEHVTGRPVVELALVFCGSGHPAQEVVGGADLDEAKAAVRRRLVTADGPTS